jgi:hypothetical protein
MSDSGQPTARYIGWDVGGWNCDKNGKSRDALVILDADLQMIGKPWRGNLRATINAAASSDAFVADLLALCGAPEIDGEAPVTLAIDTPLGFSAEFVRLVSGLQAAGPLGQSDQNPYLFRQTERRLFTLGLRPLSAVKDMIGSQATKGMHVLASFAPSTPRCGVWQQGRLTVIEAYPSACKGSAQVQGLQALFGRLAHDDLDDALTCALVAHLFVTRPELLMAPDPAVPVSEGWIWVPRDGLPTMGPRT